MNILFSHQPSLYDPGKNIIIKDSLDIKAYLKLLPIYMRQNSKLIGGKSEVHAYKPLLNLVKSNKILIVITLSD